MKIIGIAGGSGSGKSTVSYYLQDKYPDKYEVINLDDYQKHKTNVNLPMVEDMINWDHPDVIRWQNLRTDILSLKKGEVIRIKVWAHRSNPNYHSHGKMIERRIMPKPVIIIEGYLALYKKISDLYDMTFYLDLNDELRAERRRSARGGKNTIIGRDDYIDKVLKPMHKKYVEPTKKKAKSVIDVSNKSVGQVAWIVNSLV